MSFRSFFTWWSACWSGVTIRISRDDGAAALLAALVFAVHPANAQAVSWVAAQGDLLCAVFALSAILADDGARNAFSAWAEPPRRRDRGLVAAWLLATGVAALSACLSKETGVAVVLFLVARGAVRGATARGPVVRRALWEAMLVAPAVLAVGVYAVLRVQALGGFVRTGRGMDGGAIEAAVSTLAFLGRYVAELLFPFPRGAVSLLAGDRRRDVSWRRAVDGLAAA